ncbi:hypothetical protein CL634_07200 [bacterium]|nr:hypothetical protein [bacterium]
MRKIGLVPISGKPYHRGHHALIELAGNQNDEVVVYVSISDRTRRGEYPILGEAMHKVWLEEIEPIMPANVQVQYGGSPVRKIYETIIAACEENSNNIFTVYSDPADTAANYSASNRHKYMAPLYNEGNIIFAAEENPDSVTRGLGTPNIQGSDLRSALALKDFQLFAALLPEGVNAQNIYEILTAENSTEDALLKDFVAIVIG